MTDSRKYPCPECNIGELYDDIINGTFAADIKCDNPDCDYSNSSDSMRCIE